MTNVIYNPPSFADIPMGEMKKHELIPHVSVLDESLKIRVPDEVSISEHTPGTHVILPICMAYTFRTIDIFDQKLVIHAANTAEEELFTGSPVFSPDLDVLLDDEPEAQRSDIPEGSITRWRGIADLTVAVDLPIKTASWTIHCQLGNATSEPATLRVQVK